MLLGIACLPDYAFGVDGPGGSEAGPGAEGSVDGSIDGSPGVDASGFDASGTARLDPTDGGTFTFQIDRTGAGKLATTGTLTHPFAIDKLEVTVGQYRYWLEHGHALPADGASLDQGGPYATAMTWHDAWNISVAPPIGTCGNGPADYGPPSTLERPGSPELPVTCVTWFDAAAFCASQGKRLVTELEWMFAVTSRGKNFYFPWTNLPTATPLDCQHQIFDIGGDASTPGGNCNFLTAGPALQGGTEQGVLDMSGRVFEWIWDVGREFPDSPVPDYAGPLGSAVDEKRVRRGGSFNSNTGDSRLENWYREKDFGGNEPYADLGFRCAKSL
jgi:formylglycine-generating enzyme required for sulfatase activity